MKFETIYWMYISPYGTWVLVGFIISVITGTTTLQYVYIFICFLYCSALRDAVRTRPVCSPSRAPCHPPPICL